jgi:hypothetical protein
MRIRFDGLWEIVSVLAISLVACLAAAAEMRPDATLSAEGVLDDVVVSGTRHFELRAAVIKAEDRFLARYNDLNRDDDLDIECLKFTPTGSHLSYRYCMTRLQRRAQQEDASDLMTWMRNADVQSGAGGSAPAPSPMPEANVRLMERRDDYRKNLVKLLQDDPELRELVIQRADALRRYDAARQKSPKGK